MWFNRKSLSSYELYVCACVSKRSTLAWSKSFEKRHFCLPTTQLKDRIVVRHTILRIQFIYWTTAVLADMVIGHFTDKLSGGKEMLCCPLQSANNVMANKKVSTALWHSCVSKETRWIKLIGNLSLRK